MRIVKERPDYELFENNCQNFARYLVEELSPGSFCPRTIKHVFDDWISLATNTTQRGLPGAYPRTATSRTTESEMYFTARESSRTSRGSADDQMSMSVSLDDSASSETRCVALTDLQ